MAAGEIKRCQSLYRKAVNRKDWQMELETLAALRLLYQREGDRDADVRRITSLWKNTLEDCLRTVGKVLPRDRLAMYAADLKNCYKLEAEYKFESFLVFMEWERPANKRFYQPRKRVLKQCVDALQRLEDGELDILGISMSPRVGKSTLGLLYNLWIAGRHPEGSIFISGHTTPLMKSFYDGIIEFATSDEYNFKQIFPAAQLVNTDAKGLMLDFGQSARYKTISCRSIDSSMSGFIEANSLLYVDDLIQGIEEARKPERILNAYMKYETDIKQRRKDNVPLLMIGTCWSLNDPIGVEKRANKDNPRALFITIPALDENGESNFVYDYGVGFSTKYFTDTKEALDKIDEATFLSVYQQTPIESEGVCFKPNQLKRFNGILPEDGRVMTGAFTDVAWGGGDSLSTPIGIKYEVYGEKRVYVVDWVFTKESKKVSQPLVEQAIIANRVQRLRVEANNGGDEYAQDISADLRRMNHAVEVTWGKASTQVAKKDKILQYAPDIKDYFYFLEDKMQSPAYRRAFTELTSWLVTGESPHDDSPDSLSGLSEMMLGSRVGTLSSLPSRFGL